MYKDTYCVNRIDKLEKDRLENESEYLLFVSSKKGV